MEYRLEEEGYKVSKIVEPTLFPIMVAPVIETIMLKELSLRYEINILLQTYFKF